MRNTAVALLLVVGACTTDVYPVATPMGRDSGTDTDGSATLLPWRDVDGAVALEADAGAVDVMSDDDAGHMLPQRDAGVLVPPADAGAP